MTWWTKKPLLSVNFFYNRLHQEITAVFFRRNRLLCFLNSMNEDYYTTKENKIKNNWRKVIIFNRVFCVSVETFLFPNCPLQKPNRVPLVTLAFPRKHNTGVNPAVPARDLHQNLWTHFGPACLPCNIVWHFIVVTALQFYIPSCVAVFHWCLGTLYQQSLHF